MTRVFGPTRGAGVRVEEQEGSKTIDPAALGWLGYAGIMEKGPVGKLSLCPNGTLFARRHGGIIPESLLPDAAQDFFGLSNGAGGIALVRVTDGNELPASLPLFTRTSVRAQMGRLDAANGGRWGGKKKVLTGTVASLPSVAETTLTTGLTMKTDEWKGALLNFNAIPNIEYKVIGNTSSGVVTVAADQKMSTDLNAAGSISLAGQTVGAVGPYIVDDAQTLVWRFETGGDQTVTISAAPATRTTTNNATYALVDLQTLTFLKGVTTYTCIFHTVDFVAIGAATALEVKDALNAFFILNSLPYLAIISGSGVQIKTVQKGSGASLHITGGTANTALGFPLSTAFGSGNVADANVIGATVTELIALASGVITNGTAINVSGALAFKSATLGGSSTAQYKNTSTATGLGFDNATHTGVAGAITLPQRYYLGLDNEGKALSVIIGDGEQNGDGEFSIEVFVDGKSVNKYADLNTDPANGRYWVNVINNDDSNEEVSAVDLWTGAYTPSVRPANMYGVNATLTKTVLTAIISEFAINSPSGGNPTFALGTTADYHIAQTITITMGSATVGAAVSDVLGALGSVTLGSLFTSDVMIAPPFTVTAGGTALQAGDTLVVTYKPMLAGSLANGFLYPDKENSKRNRFRITDNTHKTITVSPGSDMTAVATGGSKFLVAAPFEFSHGRDGNADIVDANYQQQAWDTSTSPFLNIEGKNLGLIKFATPGVTSLTVQNAGKAYVTATNHQYRVEIPSNITLDISAISYINDTLGRSDYAVVTFPSYGYVPDPDPAAARMGKLKLISLSGMIHGRESSTASNWDGYHKAAAGIDQTLPRLLKLLTGDRKLNEELLNPAGIGIVKKARGNFVIWGDRTLWLDSNWKWKHQRELMSYYEHVLAENFDWIVFSINDASSDKLVKTALVSYFFPEWQKRALRGNKFEDAAIIKVDAELNTDAVRANGDKIASISLRLADTTERLIIRIGKQGIFEQAA